MSKYIYDGDWKAIEGTNLAKTKIRDNLSDSLEKEHLLKISTMLRNEGFMPIDFVVCDYPVEGVYCIERIGSKKGVDYFMIHDDGGILTPYYTTTKSVNGINTFPCQTIKESIKKMECWFTHCDDFRKVIV